MTTLPVDAPAVVSLTHLDEDWAVPCDFGGKIKREGDPWPCENAAEWIAWTTRCCPARTAVILLCEAHRADVLESPGFCHHCDEDFNPGSLGFRLIEPLNWRTI